MGFEHRGEIVEQISGNELEDRRERIAIGGQDKRVHKPQLRKHDQKRKVNWFLCLRKS
jgi:hypothetical protein